MWQNAEFRNTVEQQKLTIQALTLSDGATLRNMEDASKARDLLQLDKAYLQQEVRGLQRLLEEQTRSCEAHRSQCLSLEAKVSQLTDQLLSSQLTARGGFDDRMEKEVQRLRDEHARDMDGLRAAAKDVSDRENRVLREMKASLENECGELRRRNDSLSQLVSESQKELSSQMHEKTSIIGDLRAELKMKAFELTRLGVSFEVQTELVISIFSLLIALRISTMP